MNTTDTILFIAVGISVICSRRIIIIIDYCNHSSAIDATRVGKEKKE
jgi:hypothetical protein